jgi:amino acid transporter
VSLLAQAAIAVLFILLGQAGTSVKGAYDVLVSMSIISYFIPYLFMFAALIRVQREAAGPEVMQVPGGKLMAMVVGTIGFLTTAVSIGLALLPSPDELNKVLAVSKVAGSTALLLVAGALVYHKGQARRHPQ